MVRLDVVSAPELPPPVQNFTLLLFPTVLLALLQAKVAESVTPEGREERKNYFHVNTKN